MGHFKATNGAGIELRFLRTGCRRVDRWAGADKFGRKWVIVVSVFAFGVLTALAATSTDLTTLLVFRLLAGVGLGAALPNTVTLMAEYAPARRRAVCDAGLL